MASIRKNGLSRTTSIALAGLLAVAAIGAASIGQDIPAHGVSATSATADLHAFEFPGGDVADFVEAIQTQWPETNIMLDSRVASFPVSQMKLPRVNASSLLGLLVDLNGTYEDQAWWCTMSEMQVQPGVKLYRVDGVPAIRRQSTAAVRRIEVMSIAALIRRGYTVEQVRTSIEGVLMTAGIDTKSYTMHIDESTNLLAVYGSIQMTSATQATLESIDESAQYRNIGRPMPPDDAEASDDREKSSA